MHAFSPFYSPFSVSLLAPFFVVAALWTVVLKGFALWYSGRAGQKWWFIALLVVNTLGILEIVYLIWFRPDTKAVSHTHDHHSHAPMHHSSSAQ